MRMFFILLLISSLWPDPVWADPHRAREQFLACRDLLDKDKPCRALEACEAGLEAMDLTNLRALTDQARDACVKHTRAEARRKRARSQPQACPEGQSRSPETDGHCCWPGQRWEAEQCQGVPTACPVGYHLDEVAELCSRVLCEGGKVHADEDHCCWPEQIWYAPRNACLGIPHCPAGLSAQGEVCKPTIPDQDKDGIPDGDDPCPTVAEDKDGFEDSDGCPEVDNDGDGICDALFATQMSMDIEGVEIECTGSDGCPNEPEDLDGFEDRDGCADPDNDADQIPDTRDLCPNVAGLPSESGCPLPPDPTYTVVGWTGIAVGGALAITGTAVLLSTIEDRDRLNNPEVSVDENTIVLSLTEADAKALHDSIATKDTAAAITLSLGGAFLTTGAVFLILDALKDDGESAPPKVSVSYDPGSHSTWLWWRGRF